MIKASRGPQGNAKVGFEVEQQRRLPPHNQIPVSIAVSYVKVRRVTSNKILTGVSLLFIHSHNILVHDNPLPLKNKLNMENTSMLSILPARLLA